MRVVGNKLMAVCVDCGKIVRVDKPILGSAHFCTTPEERKQYRDQIKQQAIIATRLLNKA